MFANAAWKHRKRWNLNENGITNIVEKDKHKETQKIKTCNTQQSKRTKMD